MKEKDLCKAFYNQVKFLQQTNYFKQPFFIFHIPNEQRSNILYTMHLKKIGLVSGVADYCIVKKGGNAMFIEFKRNNKCKLSPSQTEFMKLCEDLDIKFLMTWDIERALDFIKENL